MNLEKETGRNFTEIIIESSPMGRTMSTAAQIAIATGIPKVHLNYRCVEFLSDLVYKNGNPIPRLMWFNKEKEEMNEDFSLKGVEFVDTDLFREESKEIFPEDANKLQKRIVSFEKYIAKQFREQEEGSCVANIIITHKWFV